MRPPSIWAACNICIIVVALLGIISCQECDFENDLCSWTQYKKDKFDWSRTAGTTSSSGTGPTSDHTTAIRNISIPTEGGTANGATCVFPFIYKKVQYTKCVVSGFRAWCSTTADYDKDSKWGYCKPTGYYLFIEASSPQKQGDNALIVSPSVTGEKCFRFWYHMYGPHIDTLNVYMLFQNGTLSGALWRKTGTQGNQWLSGNITVGSSTTGNYQIAVEAIRGVDYKGDISVDDFNFTDGSCDKKSGGGDLDTCTFENDKCGFTDDKTANFVWTRNQGGTASIGTGPTVDHTLGTAKGYYMYVEASNRNDGDKGHLSKVYNNLPLSGSCLQFYYHMFGQHQGSLNVYVNIPVGSPYVNPAFSVSGQQGNIWIKGEVPITTQQALVVFQGVTKYGYQGDMAIDDITMILKPCGQPGFCDFENGLCTWYNLPASEGKDNFDWITGSGSTSSAFTGPTADRNGDKNGKYLFLEASDPRKPGDTTRLVSELFNQTSSNGQCFGFFYHMYGSEIGKLNIYVNSSNTETLVWTLSGQQQASQGAKWRNGQVNVGLATGPYIVIVEGVRGNGYRGDISVDGFSFKSGLCDVVPSEASPKTPQTTQQVTTTIPTQPPAKIFDCDFEQGLCSSWSQDKSTDNLDWTLNTGATSSTGTGPTTDHTKGTQYGQYVYLEASGTKFNQTARLISTSIPGTADTNGKCLIFWYHMYGPSVNQLNVYVMHGSHITNPVWSRTGSQGNQWIKGQVTLVGTQQFNAVFEATTGQTYQGDIALDDISLTTQPCVQPSTTCTFEDGQCGYVDDQSSDTVFSWTWQSQATSSASTGPTTDHTKQSVNGFYMYTEASGRKPGDKARLLGPINPPTTGKCLTFWYHMYGGMMGTLSVYLKINNVLQSRPLWSESGDKGNTWKVASQTVVASRSYQVAFEGKVGRGYQSDMAIDDVSLTDGPCPQPGFCDFESGICDYVNLKTDSFDWIVGSAGTPSAFTGPRFDHTTGSSNGSYVFLEVSAPRKQGDVAILSSQQFNSVGGKQRCLSFWYHMYGSDIGQLQVIYKVFSGSQQETLLWNLTGQQQISENDPWKNGRVPISMDADHVVMFKGVAGSGYRGDIAIDDIEYTSLACKLEPAEADPNGVPTAVPTTPFPRTRQTTLAPSALGCNFETGYCSLLQDSTDKFNWTRVQGFTDTQGTGPSQDHTFGEGAVQPNGPGSIRHAAGKCLHVYQGAWNKPNLDTGLVLYDGCGQDRLEFVITPQGYLKLTKWNMCVRLKGDSTTNGAEVGLTDTCRDQWKMLSNGALQHQATQLCLSPLKNAQYPSNNWKLVVYQTCTGLNKQFAFTPTMGWYAFIEASSPRTVNDTARLVSPTTSAGKCLNFWYHMYGAHINKLNVYVKTPNGPLGTPIWSKYGSQGDTWKAAHVYMDAKGPYQYVIEAVRGDGYQGDIAIDDVEVTDGACKGPLECSFEETNPPMCGFTNAKDDDFDWSIGQGQTSSVSTGPSNDHTYNDANGKYIFIETSGSIKSGSIARLISPDYPGNSQQKGQCFQFWYHMYGSSIGKLELFLQKSGQQKGAAVWSKSTDQGNKWSIGQLSISSQGSYKLIFEATRGSSYTGDIALDDFKMYDGICNSLATCDFESEKCTWKNTPNEDTFDWIIGQGNTPSRWTGPKTDHSTQSGNGHYMFIEASKPRKKYDIARLVSEPIDRHTVWFIKYCLRFWYHMSGASIGTLNVLLKTGIGKSNEQVLWSLSGNQGNTWYLGTVPMYSKLDYQMVFEAIHGGGTNGDIAIDDITYSIGNCPVQPSNANPNFVTTPKPTFPPTTAPPTQYDCNFETKTTCGWTQDKTDKFDWRLNSGSTSSQQTGPSADHTYNNATGNYLYIETSSSNDGDNARLISPSIHGDSTAGHSHCLKFWFHMYGPHINALNVYIMVGSSLTLIWKRVGDNGNQWRYGQVDLTNQYDYKAVIEGIKGKGYKGDISIDDIELLDGGCPIPISCDFEHDKCKLTDDQTADFTWTRNKGTTSSVGTGPPYDHTLQTAMGFYMYTEASGRRKMGDKARLISPVFPTDDPQCFTFWFHMKGWHIGELNIYVQAPNSGRSLIWKRSGNHGDEWKIARVTIRPRAGRQLVFEGVRGLSFSGDIAIDDLSIQNGYCSPPGDCSFEGDDGFCSWSNVKSAKLDDFDWIIGSGGTPSFLTGPSVDHTTGTKTGKYVYIEASTPNQGDAAWLISEDFYPSLGRCVQFWAHMYGSDIGTLNVYVRSQNGTMRRVWTLDGQQGSQPQWFEGQAPIVSLEDYQIVFEAVRGGGSIGDIALDDIIFTNFLCQNIPSNSVPPDPTTPLPTTPATTPSPTPVPNYYTCNFTNDKCTWSDDKTADFQWQRAQGKTTSAGTGPEGDHTTGPNGWYVYIETSSPRKPNDTARLVSADVPATSQMCLQFWYHMYGDHIENLTAYMKQGSVMTPLWQKSGTQGPRWRHAVVDLSSSTTFQIVLEGVKGSGYRGDIALDDLSLNDGVCPPQAECTFEDPNLCGWTNIAGDNFDWTRDNAGTSSTGTGPQVDHTYGTRSGYYMYIEASNPRSKGHKAWLQSGDYQPTLGRCLSFWYHMFGQHIGSLNVLLSNQNGSRSAPLWSLSGTQGNRWKPSKVTITSSELHRIIFEGITGDSYRGDIAIDDVMVTEGSCPDYGNCDFESDLCGYVNEMYGDNFDWETGTGSTSSVTTGPTTDHSTGTAQGRYLFIESSYPRLIHETAIITSETIPTSGAGKCVTFWYHMYGDDIGTLKVNMRVGNDLSETTSWALSGNQGNRWFQGQAPLLSRGVNLEIRFEGIRGGGYKGDIAIDDVVVVDYSNCPIQPSSAQPWGCNFEESFCRWQQLRTDNFDWRRNKGHTQSTDTGPSVDHTSNTTSGYYGYIEASFPRKPNDTAALVSPVIRGNGTKQTYCFWFAYHMYGPHVNILQVYTKTAGEQKPVIWKRKGSQGPDWRHAEVQIQVYGDTQVIIEGIRGDDYKGDIAIDDLDVWYGDCFSSGICTFEGADICRWYVNTAGQLKWQRGSGSTPSVQTGPTFDHTYGTGFGHYMYIETSVAPPNAIADMYSPWYWNDGQKCIQFFYHMYGDQIGKLTVYLRYSNSAYLYIGFTQSGNQNNTWHMGQATVTRKNTYFQMVVRGQKGAGYKGDIAVDDFRIRDGACPAPGDCDFEHDDTCSWMQGSQDDFDWIIGSGKTVSYLTGPKIDHTTQTNGGKYVFIETSAPRNTGDKATLQSMPFQATSGTGVCMSFWYHMYGASIGTLNLYLQTLNGVQVTQSTLMWSLSGNQGDQWFNGRMPIQTTDSYQLLFEAVRGTSYTGDIALDDFEFTPSSCAFTPTTAWPNGRTTLAPTPGITTLGPTTGNTGHDCNFDKNFCPTWVSNATRKEFDWRRHQGSTSSFGTGPKNDHTTNSDQGYYVYIETSSPAQENDTAWLIGQNIPNDRGRGFCLSFWYHMYGPHVGTLNVYAQLGNLKWRRVGTQGDQWRHGQVYVDNGVGSPVTVVFEGIRGKGYAGDIALDDIQMTNDACPAERECTFEQLQWSDSSNNLMCGWSQDKQNDDFDWSIGSASTPSVQTGPSVDHTLKTNFGHYVYIETSSPRKFGEKAMMISQSYQPTTGQCFTFWYHMFGSTIGNLTLLLRKNGVDSPLWYRNQDEGDEWKPGMVTLKSPTTQFQLAFLATVGRSYTGDIAIDDILLIDGECPLPGDCTFEEFGSCTYTQEQVEDDFDWIIGSGSTSSWKTGPTTDYTKKDKTGQYYYIEASAPRKEGDRARLVSELFEATSSNGRCLQFFRHMYGTAVGKFNVYVKTGPGNASESLVWSDSGNQGNAWIQSQAPIQSDKPFRLVFEAIRGSSYTGDIAIDDINFNNNESPCTYIPDDAAPPTLPPTTITPGDSNCTFDNGLCRWKQSNNDDFDWTLIKGNTGSAGTGPLGDHTTGTGQYIYIEASYPRKPNDTAILTSPSIRPTVGAVCFTFWYHMHGAHVESLYVYRVYNGRRTRVWKRVGTQGNQWRRGQVNIRGITGIFNLEVEAVRGTSYLGDISLDDFNVTTGRCPPPPYCDFENGKCGFRNLKSSSKFNWKRSNGGTPSLGTGPTTDHTTQTALGTYYYIETSYPRKKGDNAIIYSRKYSASANGNCFNFWYHMYGSHIGALNIYLDSIKSPPVWNKTDDQGDVWRHGRVTVTSKDSFKLYIEGVVGSSYKGDIAIDDIWIEDTPCPTPGSCDFEGQSFCAWSQVPNANNKTGYDDFDWELGSGSTPSVGTGPIADHTIGTSLGTYAFIEVSNVATGLKAQLISEVFQATRGKCLSFWYHMLGSGIGSLNFMMKDTKQTHVMKSIVGNQGNRWINGEVGLHSSIDFQVIIEAVRGSSYNGDISLDDLKIYDGNCVGTCESVKPAARVACGPGSVSPATCINSFGCCWDDSTPNVPYCFQHPSNCLAIPPVLRSQCGYDGISQSSCTKQGCCYDDTTLAGFKCFYSPISPTDFPSTVAPPTQPPPSVYDCDFENGICGYINTKGDQFNWTIHKGSTGSWGTGPSFDHTKGNADGYYAYIETSYQKANDTANLETPFINFLSNTDRVCVRFWYHMYGQHVGAFNVFYTLIPGDVPKDPLWQRTGSIVNKWIYGQLTVPKPAPFKIVFQGVRGPGYQGDIAIDDVGFVDGPCPPNLFCDFENKDLCGWSQDGSDDFDWSFGYGNTTSWNTGPHWDHTYGTGYGNYLYIEGSYPRQPGDKARIESFVRPPTTGACVEFFYHMKGSGIGSLNVYLRRGQKVEEQPVFTLTGEQGDEWERALITVVEDSQNWNVIIEGIRGGDYFSDIAIDDVRFHKGKCTPKGDCDFENDDACGYENLPSNKVDWLVYSGATPSFNTGPQVDHTTNTKLGHYLYMEASHPAKKGDIGQIASEKFKVNPNYRWCLEFWYHMFGTGVGSLRVKTRYISRYSKGKFLYNQQWSEDGNHDDKWLPAQVNISSSYDFQIVFEAEIGTGDSYRADIAIDDLKVTQGLCQPPPPPPTPNPCLRKCRDGSCVSSTKVCDFYPDCAQGSDSSDTTDEDGCDGCDFENGTCYWQENSKGIFKWFRKQGKTGSYNTGPTTDHTKGNGLGYYMYVEASRGSKFDLATLDGPTIKQSSSSCTMTFWYHMYGSSIGELSVFVVNNLILTQKWKLNGNQGDSWQQATVYVNRQTSPFQVKFQAERSTSYQGDISIDDIQFNDCALPAPAKYCSNRYSFRCSVTRACISYSRKCDFTDDCGDNSDEESCNYRDYPYMCNFEYSFCYWKNLKDDQFDFTRAKGHTDSDGTGPMFDHTTGKSTGYYIYSEASYQRRGDKARLGSGLLAETYARSQCSMRFYYHMYGDHIGRLSVKTRQCETCQETLVWSRNESAGNFWVRKAVYLSSDKPFQVIIESERGDGYKGDIALDDISFYDCTQYFGQLPTAIPTIPPSTTPNPCKPDASGATGFYCIKDQKCISRGKKCDYRNDCSDGQDEDHCGACDFEKDECGYKDLSTGMYSVGRSQPLTDGTGNGPKTDHTSNSTKGNFGMVIQGTGSTTNSPAIYESPNLAATAANCTLEFYYYSSDTKYGFIRIYHRQDVDTKPVETEVFYQYLGNPTNGWQKGWIQLGSRPAGWELKFQINKLYGAIDDISFANCAFPRRTGVCPRTQIGCDNGGCIYPNQMCDFVNNCGDNSDEKEAICKNYKERCNFEDDICNWIQDKDDDFDWQRSSGKTSSSGTGPGFDHTTGHRLGYYMFIETSSPRKANDTARLNSVVFKPSSGCRMRFFYHMYGSHVDTLSIKLKLSANDLSPLTTLWTMSGDQGNVWHFAELSFVKMNSNFRVVIEAKRGVSFKGDIAIDDVSFTPECVPDFKATLNPDLITPSPPPDCASGQFSCGDGQCIDAHKVCNFHQDCKNGKDEERCPSSCDFEGGSSCLWFNAKFSDGMDWKVIQGKTPTNGTGPTYDHTKQTAEGWYAYVEATQSKTGSFPNALFISPLYYQGAYDCKFSFWYNMYHYQISGGSDVKLNVLYRRSGKETKLWAATQSTGDQWKQATIQLPKCPRDFRILFEGSHYWGSKTDAAIDDIQFSCAEPTIPTSCTRGQFQCTVTRQCIEQEDICDGERNCCDGSDENDDICKGYTKLDFESGLNGWTQLLTDEFEFDIQSGKTSSTGTGPTVDHTTQEEHGKYAYIEASLKQENDSAALASPTIATTQTMYANYKCSVSFWYHMFGEHIGSLTVFTATQYGVPEKQVFYMAGDQGDEWKKAKVDLDSSADFQIILEARMGSSYKGDIAIDDIWFSPGCIFNNKPLPGGPTQPPVDPCLPDFQCVLSGVCLPRNQVCDFSVDCPGGTDENNSTCGYPQGFENGFGAWTNAQYDQLDFELRQGPTPSGQTGPTADARGDKLGYYAYLEVSNRKKDDQATITSPSYGGAYAQCTMNFYYHMYGKDTGILRIYLLSVYQVEDGPDRTILFELKGDQGNNWVKSRVSIGRRYDPFYLNFTATVGGGYQGDIAIDEITFENCAHPPPCIGNDPGKFMCSNSRCIDPIHICNFIDDCGDSSDEILGGICNDYMGCDFENENFDACNFTQDKNGDDFDWTRNHGWTPSYNTGPTRDHTYGDSVGHYMYIEASGRKVGDKARLISLPIEAKKGGSCQLRFYYHMFGQHAKDLNVYVLRVKEGSLIFKYSASGDYGDVWMLATVDLSGENDVFRLVFEGIVGTSYRSDIAIDDVILNPDCLTNASRVFPTRIPCQSDQFRCITSGKCLRNTTQCDGKFDCRDKSDEASCTAFVCQPGQFKCTTSGACVANTTRCDGKKDCGDLSDERNCGGSTEKQTGSGISKGTSIIAASAVGGLIVLLIIVLVAYIIVKRRKEKKLHLFSVFYDPTKQEEEQKKKKGESSKGVSIKSQGVSNPVYDEQPTGDFSMGELDTDMFTDGGSDFVVPVETKGGATSMANPLYQDPYMEDDDSPLSNF